MAGRGCRANLTNEGKGRIKGVPNKFTTAKQAFLDAFKELGGKDFVMKVANNPRGAQAVLQAMARLIPNKQELSGPDGGPINAKIEVGITFVGGVKEKKN